METQQTNIVIIGAGLTGLTTAFRLCGKQIDVRLLECSSRVGGQIQTLHQEGFTFESGPNTGVVSYPEVAELFSDLASYCALETANEAAKRRLIWKGNRFHALPSGLWGGITTPLFSLYDKFRILGEPLRAKGTNPDESVGQMGKRRLGRSFLNYAIDPFLSGVYAGDPTKLITRYALPKLYNLEQTYGSFIKGAVAKAKLPKTKRDALATKRVFSAVGGLENLVLALEKAIGSEKITLSAAGIEVQPHGEKWKITYTTPEGKQTLIANKVVTTTGAYTLPQLLPFVDKQEMMQISNLQYAPIVQVSVGVRDTGSLRFNAFGGLVPSREGKEVLGILYPSACFAGRAPQGGALFSFFIGGVKHEELTRYTDLELKKLVGRVFHSMLKFPAGAAPDLIQIFRHPRAIPQYEQSSGARFDAIARIQASYPGLILSGNIRDGIGMADRIRQATEVAMSLSLYR